MTALVLSAGGMFGAYQAGVWKSLARRLKPDIVIGASAGSLNAWSIAGGATPDELAAAWLDDECGRMAQFRLFQPPWRGCFDYRALHKQIESLWARYHPVMPVGVVATEIPALRPRLFRDAEITWRHLAASCAVLLCYPQVQIGGRWYTDGGLLGVLPMWAAEEAGATRVVAINALPVLPSRTVRLGVAALKTLARKPARFDPVPETVIIEPKESLGTLREAVFWRRDAVERWLAQGEADGSRVGLE